MDTMEEPASDPVGDTAVVPTSQGHAGAPTRRRSACRSQGGLMVRARSGIATAVLVGLVAMLGTSAVSAQSPTSIDRVPGASPSATASPAPVPWPTLPPPVQVPLPAPFEPTGPPAATTTRHRIKMEVWLSSEHAAPGEWVQLLVRTTNLGRVPAWSASSECGSSGTSATVDLQPVIPTGQEQTGNAAAFKRMAIADSSALLASFLPWRYLADSSTAPADGLAVGSWAECGTLPGPLRLRARATLEERFAWYPAGSFDGRVWFQPLPPGTVPVTIAWPFIGRGGHPPRHPSRMPVRATASIELTGDGPGTPSLPELVDIALADPTFRAWVDEDPTRATWDGVYVDGSPGPTYQNDMLLRDLQDAPPTGILTLELDRTPASRGVISLDPWTGRVLRVQFLGD